MQRHIPAADKNLTKLNSVSLRYDSVPFYNTEEPLFIGACFSSGKTRYVTYFDPKCKHREWHLGNSRGAVHTN